MSAYRKSGGSNVALSLANIKRRSGTGWITATIAKRRSGGVWVNLFSAVVDIVTQTISVWVTSPDDASATYTLSNTGSGWLTGGTPSDYDVEAVQVSLTQGGSGTSITGTLNTRMNLGTTRSWNAFCDGIGNCTWVLDITIRRVSDNAIMDTARITLEAVAEYSGGG